MKLAGPKPARAEARVPRLKVARTLAKTRDARNTGLSFRDGALISGLPEISRILVPQVGYSRLAVRRDRNPSTLVMGMDSGLAG
jgi:hypothetical protein